MRQRRVFSVRTSLLASRAIREQLAALEQKFSSQQQHIAEQEKEILQQREEITSQQERIAQHEAEVTLLGEALSAQGVSAPIQLPASVQTHDSPVSPRTSRRALLIGSAGVATGIVVAGGLMMKTEVAHADGGAGDGTNIVQGAANINTSSTGTILQPVVSTNPATLFTVDNSASGSITTDTSGLTALGPTNTNGVIGIGNGSGGYGVWGKSDAGVGVVGQTSTGIDLGAFGTGRFQQIPQVFQGAPTTGTYIIGEQLRDAAGNLWICVENGTPGLWRKVAAPQVGFTGGAPNFLSAPIRIFDTRPGQSAPLPATKQLLSSFSTTAIQVTGTVVGGVSVPSGAVAVVGNLTVTGTQGGGDLILFPHGAAQPLTSNINYVGGQTLANFAVIGLSAGGAMDLFVHGSGTHALFDVAGFIM